MPSKKSSTATHFCKICHREISQKSIFDWVFTAKFICAHCYASLEPRLVRWKENGVTFTSIYPYREAYQSLLYLYKGCGDIELSGTFLERLLPLLKLKYHDYVLIPAPSHISKVAERGFDHVPLMFEGLGKKVLPLLRKTKDVKQSDLSAKERRNVGNILAFTGKPDLRHEKVLFVDDVFTTGSTARACIKLIQKLKPKKIEALVVAKVPKNRHEEKR